MTSPAMITLSARLHVPEHSLYAVSFNVNDAPRHDPDDLPSDLRSGQSIGGAQ